MRSAAALLAASALAAPHPALAWIHGSNASYCKSGGNADGCWASSGLSASINRAFLSGMGYPNTPAYNVPWNDYPVSYRVPTGNLIDPTTFNFTAAGLPCSYSGPVGASPAQVSCQNSSGPVYLVGFNFNGVSLYMKNTLTGRCAVSDSVFRIGGNNYVNNSYNIRLDGTGAGTTAGCSNWSLTYSVIDGNATNYLGDSTHQIPDNVTDNRIGGGVTEYQFNEFVGCQAKCVVLGPPQASLIMNAHNAYHDMEIHNAWGAHGEFTILYAAGTYTTGHLIDADNLYYLSASPPNGAGTGDLTTLDYISGGQNAAANTITQVDIYQNVYINQSNSVLYNLEFGWQNFGHINIGQNYYDVGGGFGAAAFLGNSVTGQTSTCASPTTFTSNVDMNAGSQVVNTWKANTHTTGC